MPSQVAASTTATTALWVSLYAGATSTAVALMTLYGDLFQRLKIEPHEGTTW